MKNYCRRREVKKIYIDLLFHLFKNFLYFVSFFFFFFKKQKFTDSPKSLKSTTVFFYILILRLGKKNFFFLVEKKKKCEKEISSTPFLHLPHLKNFIFIYFCLKKQQFRG